MAWTLERKEKGREVHLKPGGKKSVASGSEAAATGVVGHLIEGNLDLVAGGGALYQHACRVLLQQLLQQQIHVGKAIVLALPHPREHVGQQRLVQLVLVVIQSLPPRSQPFSRPQVYVRLHFDSS